MTRKFTVAVACAIVAGCGGGSGSSGTLGSTGAPAVSPGGIYSASITNSFAGGTDTGIGLITESGDGVFVDQTNPAIFRIKTSVSGTSLSGTFRGYAGSGYVFANNSSTETGTISGTVTQRASIQGTYSGPNNTTGSITLTYQGAQYEVPTPLTTIAGTYQFTVSTSAGTDTVTFTVSSSGQIVGSTVSGCNVNGTMAIPSASFNAQSFSFTSTCSGVSTSYTGLSTYSPATSTSQANLSLEYDDGNTTAVAVDATKQ